MTMRLLILLLPVILSTLSNADASDPPILSTSLTSQILPSNLAISSAFIIPGSSALLVNVSSPFPALRVPPSWSFSIGFRGDTFLPPLGGSQKLTLTAHLDNGNPIPDWLVFDPNTMTFGGVTPKEIVSVQVLRIIVTASTASNMTTSDAFSLIVSPHDLSLSGPLLTHNVTAANMFNIVIDDWTGIQVDGAPVNMTSLSTSDSANLSLSLDTSSFPWLKYDPTSYALSGTPLSSSIGVPMATIPARVTLTLSKTTQYLVVYTNLTIVVFPSLFTAPNLPDLLAPAGSAITFTLAPYVTNGSATSNKPGTDNRSMEFMSSLNVSAIWEPSNATWLGFNPNPHNLTLTGMVPDGPPKEIQVTFQAVDETKGTISRAQMRIITDQEAGGPKQLPTDTLTRTGKQIKLAVGVVFGIAAVIILLACFLAICRHCCVVREKVDGAHVTNQSAFSQSNPYKSGVEKDDYSADGTYTEYLSPTSMQPPAIPGLGQTMTKAAFFDALRARLGNDGNRKTKHDLGRNRSPSSGSSSAGGSEKASGSMFSSGKRPRKSKISKPMAVVSSSTSIRDGFAERGRSGIAGVANVKGVIPTNSTNFGGVNNAGKDVEDGRVTNVAPPSCTANRDVPFAIGRVLISSPGTAILAYDRTHSRSESPPNSVQGSAGNEVVINKEQSGSASAPSLDTGTRSGTQSTFATGDSTRLTNAAGEVPFRRPGFDGRWETLGERTMRQIRHPLSEGASNMEHETVASPRSGPSFLSCSLVKGGENQMPASSTPMSDSKSATSSGSTPGQSKSASSKIPTPSTPSTSNTHLESTKSTKVGNKRSPPNRRLNDSEKLSMPQESDTPSKIGWTFLKPSSDRSLDTQSSSVPNVFLGDKDNESDSSTEDAENAVITQVVNRSPDETPAKTTKSGKPRLVAFTHERTTPVSGQGPRRDVSQRVVLQGEESDAEAEMRMGLEYVRQLGDPDTTYEFAHASTNTRPSTQVSMASDAMRLPQREFYASNDSNNSIAGRARVLAPLVINSHRNRHQAHSITSTHDSFLSLAEHEGEPHESRWMVESTLPRFAFSAKEPFNFAVPLDREHKHASVLAGSALEAKQSDGKPLPEWLRFDKVVKEFWGVTPKATKGEMGETLVTRVIVKVWDGERGEVVGGCVVDVLGEKG